MKFLDSAVTSWHAAEELEKIYRAAGFLALKESDTWQVEPGGRYTVRRDGALIAFTVGGSVDKGIALVASHTDSPGFRLKPGGFKKEDSGLLMKVEPYGSPLVSQWLDRDLGIAGVVTSGDGKGRFSTTQVCTGVPVALVPGVAPHLDAELNRSRPYTLEKEFQAIFGTGKDLDFEEWLRGLCGDECDGMPVIESTLHLYSTEKASVNGVDGSLLSSGRLDNLASAWISAEAHCHMKNEEWTLAIYADNEETGSQSRSGAAGSFLNDVTLRLLPDTSDRIKMYQKSMLLSVDGTHAMVPAYADKFDSDHAPLLNAGPALKYHSGGSYSTDSKSGACLRHYALDADIPLQIFVNRADARSGSTIGPVLSSHTGISAVDLGIPLLAMHSPRETAGIRDIEYLYGLIVQHFEHWHELQWKQ